MADKVQAVPAGFHTLTPHLTVRNADKALEFYKNALGAEIQGVARMPDGKIMHAALRVGDSMLMLNEEMPGVRRAVAAVAQRHRSNYPHLHR